MILVTGANGTIGREVVKQLVAQGVAVRALVRDSAKAGALQRPKVEIVTGDLDEPTSLTSALTGISHALLLSVTSPSRVQQETNFIQAAQRAAIQHIVKISILGAATDSSSRILQWHGQAEKILGEANLAHTILRPNYFMQNLFWSLADIRARGVFNSSLPVDTKHSHVDARDIAAVAVACLTESSHAGQIYHLTGPEALTYPEVADSLSRILGRPIRYDPSPDNYAKFLTPFGMDIPDVLELDRCVARGEGDGAILTDAVAQVARKQPYTLEQFVNDYSEVFQNG